MHPEFPLECTCSHRRERFQLAFARRALEFLPQADDTSFQPGSRGLIVLAETETALERPIGIIREVFGDQVNIGPPTVRYRRGATLEEPHMGVRVLCAPEHFAAVKADLERRLAVIVDSEVNRQFGVVRATAPLAELLGYPRRLSELTGGRGQHMMWFSHYAPVQDEPPGGNAA